MKFKFCGNIDCPEWLITEIAFLNKINSVKLRILSNNICNIIISRESKYDALYKMLEEMNYSYDDSNIIISVLVFIIKSSVKFEVDSIILNQELQQLGLPQENSESITKVYKSNQSNLTKILENDIFQYDGLFTPNLNLVIKQDKKEKISNKESEISKPLPVVEWKVNYIIADKYKDFNKSVFNDIKEEEDTGVTLTSFDAKIDVKFNDKVFCFNKEMLGGLINELEKAKNIIKKQNGK